MERVENVIRSDRGAGLSGFLRLLSNAKVRFEFATATILDYT
jgi:hypothetical protein